MTPGMPKGKAPKLFLGVHARLVFLKKEDEWAILDLMRRFSSATRYAYNRLLEGKTREELKRENGPLCTLFGLNTRYADGTIEKVQATLDSAKELGQDPRKVVFGGRKLFDQLKRRHLSGKALLALKRERKERRQGLLYSRGNAAKKGNRDGALLLRVNLGKGAYVHALVQTSHPQLKALCERVYASLPYNVNPSCHLPPGPEKIEAAMLSRTIAAFCIIDDALQAMGHKDDPQTKVPSSVILTLAILAAMELGGKHNKALALAKDLNLFTHVPSPSRFNRRLHALYPLFLPLLHLLSQVWKNLHQAQAYALDTFPLPACENIRAPRSRLFPHKVYRGFVPSKRVYFHGPKLHLLVDDGKFIHEVNLSPGSWHDLTSLLLLPLDLPEGAELYMDRGYESHLYEDLLREAQGIVPMVIRRGNSRRYVPWLQYLAIVGRRVVETVGGMLHAMFPRRIHAVTQEGFVIKVLSFVLAHNLKLLTQEMA
jgi:predicted transposase